MKELLNSLRKPTLNLELSWRKEGDDNHSPGGISLESDQANVRRLVSILEKFYELTLRILGSLYNTSYIFFHDVAKVLCNL